MEPGISATNISSKAKVPMLAGSTLFIATETAYAATIGRKPIDTFG